MLQLEGTLNLVGSLAFLDVPKLNATIVFPAGKKPLKQGSTVKFLFEYNNGTLALNLNGLYNDGMTSCFLGELGFGDLEAWWNPIDWVKKIGRGVGGAVKGTLNAVVNTAKAAWNATKKAREAIWKYNPVALAVKSQVWLAKKAWKHKKGLLQVAAVAALVTVAIVAAPALVGAAGAIGNAAASAAVAVGKTAVAAGKFALSAGKFAIRNYKTIDNINTIRQGAQSLIQQHPGELTQSEAEQIMTAAAQETQQAVAHPEQYPTQPQMFVETEPGSQVRKAGFLPIGIGIVSLLLVAGIAIPMLIKRG